MCFGIANLLYRWTTIYDITGRVIFKTTSTRSNNKANTIWLLSSPYLKNIELRNSFCQDCRHVLDISCHLSCVNHFLKFLELIFQYLRNSKGTLYLRACQPHFIYLWLKHAKMNKVVYSRKDWKSSVLYYIKMHVLMYNVVNNDACGPVHNCKETINMYKRKSLTCFTTGEKFPIASIMRRDDRMFPSAICKTYWEKLFKPLMFTKRIKCYSKSMFNFSVQAMHHYLKHSLTWT